MERLLNNWREYLLLEGSKKSHYQGSPIGMENKTEKRKKRERRNKRKTQVTFGMTDPFSRSELELLRPGSISNVSEDNDSNSKKEPDCIPGNPIHDKETGKFGEPTDPGTWSKGYHSSKGKAGCKKGKLRKPGSGKATVWTKADKCGRDGPYLCGTKDTKKWNSPNLKEVVHAVIAELWSEFSKEQYAVFEGQQGNITADTCRRMGFKTFGEFLKSIDAIKRAEQGKLLPEKE